MEDDNIVWGTDAGDDDNIVWGTDETVNAFFLWLLMTLFG